MMRARIELDPMGRGWTGPLITEAIVPGYLDGSIQMSIDLYYILNDQQGHLNESLPLDLNTSYAHMRFTHKEGIDEAIVAKRYQEELIDYEEDDEKAPDSATAKASGDAVKKGYVGIHSSGFRDFLLKPELLRAIVDSGFEHPSEGKI
ncbi:hypothetical protein AgCh_018218 [Apium graveolens]